MSLSAVVTNGLRGAMLMARGRPEGLQYIETDMAGAARSFWAVALSVPPIVIMRLMGWLEFGAPDNAARVLTRDLLVYGVSWVAFTLVSFRIANSLGRAPLWPRFIATWNWCNVIGNMMVMLGGIPDLLGVSTPVDQAARLVVMGWALWLEWFAVRLSFGTGPLLGAYIVVLDQLIGLVFAVMGASLGTR